MNIKNPVLLTVIAILTVSFAIFRFLTRNISSIGIIGSADGPTAVFIASGGGKTYIYGIALIIIVFVALRFILKRII